MEWNGAAKIFKQKMDCQAKTKVGSRYLETIKLLSYGLRFGFDANQSTDN
mgnify:FL=1